MQQPKGGTGGDLPVIGMAAGVSRGAFDDLYQGCVDDLFAYLARRVGADLAEELTAQTFCDAWAGIASFDPTRGSFRAWVFGIASHHLARHWRTEQRRLRAYARHGTGPVAVDNVEAAVNRIDAERTLAALAGALSHLRTKDLTIVLLWAEDGLTYDEIAQAVGIPVGTVRSRLSRARRKLEVATGATRG